ncbi:murinoglobulin-1-like [Rhinophrynus dorsalis]
MVVIDIKLLSGYQPDYWSLRELENLHLVSRAEEQNNHIYLYLKSVTHETIQLSVKVQIGNRVLNVKSSSVYAYDYYAPEENGFASYNHPCPAAE